jgi:hypothetical protein
MSIALAKARGETASWFRQPTIHHVWLAFCLAYAGALVVGVATTTMGADVNVMPIVDGP